MNILIDASLSPRIARALDAVFGSDDATCASVGAMADAALACREQAGAWIGIDLDSSTQPHRMTALAEMGRHLVLLAPEWIDLSPADQASLLLRVMPRILKRLRGSGERLTLLVTAGPAPRIRKAT